MIRSQRGFILPDFIFAIILTSAMSVLLFSISYSLVVVEVTQYVSFATSRAHMAGNKDPEQQKEKARRKYESLVTGRGEIASLYSNGWFEVAKRDGIDIRGGATADGRTFSDDLAGGSDLPTRNWFIGVSVPLTIRLMNFRFPLLGRTAEENEDGFKTRLNTMLIRDPSEKECRDFMDARGEFLRQLPSAQVFYDPGAYVPLEDNGC